ncbi:class I SAM-dependent methyltransferase [Pseudoclavibacter alba]|nr:class I SAM-dependent methyltransferase [Pseudoclavibacter alba]MBN6778739.1 class I SAM-dependent methyltransferase [Pseudoclavibacter alba]
MREVSEAYGRRSDEYVRALGSLDSTHAEDQKLISRWGRQIKGPIIDVGCGPGHWTEFLTAQGCNVRGIDPTVEFITSARQRFSQCRFALGSAESLPANSAMGILAWYSLIHHDPVRLDIALQSCHAALSPGGSFLVGFFTAPAHAPFSHAVTTAYFWPLNEFVSCIEHVGFTVLETHERHDTTSRPHGAIVAQRS